MRYLMLMWADADAASGDESQPWSGSRSWDLSLWPLGRDVMLFGMSGRGTGRLSFDPEAAARVRRLLSGRDDVVERTMVGGLSFLVNGNMCCGVTGTALMIRVGADGREQALREPHARPMLLGGRVLSGFICVEPAGYAADDALASWVKRGLDFVSGLPAKPVRASS